MPTTGLAAYEESFIEQLLGDLAVGWPLPLLRGCV
jgi:hypothetical protein